MALEAQEVTVGVRLLGGAAFERDAKKVAESIRGIGDADKSANAKGGLLATLSNAGTVMSRVGGKMVKFGSTVRNIGRGLMTLSVPIAYIGYQGVKAFSGFQQAMVLLQSQALDSGRDVAWLTKQVLALPAAFGDPTQLAQGLYPIVSAGKHGKVALNDLKAAAMGAKAGIDTVTNTAQALMGVMNTGLKGANNPMGVMSTLDAIVGSGMMRLPDLMQAMHSEIIPMAKDVGMSFQDVGAALAAFTRMNIPAETAARLMKLSLTKMFDPTGGALKALRSIGLTQFQLANDLRKPHGLITALADLKKHLQAVSPDQRNAILATAFGQSRGVANIATLLNALPTMQAIMAKVGAASPATLRRHFNQQNSTAAGKLAQIRAQINKSLITLGQAILPTLLPLLTQVTSVVRTLTGWFNGLPRGAKSALVKIAATLIVLGPVLYGVGTLFMTVGSMLRLIAPIATTVFPAMAEVLPEIGEGFLGLLGPIGLLTGALVLAYDAIKPFHNAVNSVVKWVSNAFNSLFGGGKKKSKPVPVQGAPPKDQSAVLLPNGHWADVRRPRKDPWAVMIGGHWADTRRPSKDPWAVRLKNGAWADTRFPGLASGGIVYRSGVSLVGEAGPELLSLPQGARVDPLPHLTGRRTRPTLDGLSTDISGAWQITVDSPVYLDGQMIARSVNTVNREKANRR